MRQFVVKALLGPVAFLGIAAGLLLPSPSAAAETSHVALIVQSGPGVKPDSTCGTYAKRMSGFDLLRQAGHEVTYQAKTYKLLQLDGLPVSPSTDKTHYWAYFYRLPGSDWAPYRQNGAESLPLPGTVEAWLYFDGKAYDPPDLAFEKICGTSNSAAASGSQPAATTTGRSATTAGSGAHTGPVKPSGHATTKVPSGRGATAATASPPTSFEQPLHASAVPGLPTESGGKHAQGAGPLVLFVLGGLAVTAALVARAIRQQNERQ